MCVCVCDLLYSTKALPALRCYKRQSNCIDETVNTTYWRLRIAHCTLDANSRDSCWPTRERGVIDHICCCRRRLCRTPCATRLHQRRRRHFWTSLLPSSRVWGLAYDNDDDSDESNVVEPASSLAGLSRASPSSKSDVRQSTSRCRYVVACPPLMTSEHALVRKS